MTDDDVAGAARGDVDRAADHPPWGCIYAEYRAGSVVCAEIPFDRLLCAVAARLECCDDRQDRTGRGDKDEQHARRSVAP